MKDRRISKVKNQVTDREPEKRFPVFSDLLQKGRKNSHNDHMEGHITGSA